MMKEEETFEIRHTIDYIESNTWARGDMEFIVEC